MTELEYLLSQQKQQATAPGLGIQEPQPTVVDGDTLRDAYGNLTRYKGFDTMESYDSAKARRVEDEYGVDFALQKELGTKGTDKLRELYGNYATVDAGVGGLGRPMVESEELTEAMITAGVAVPSSRYDDKAQALYRSTINKENSLYGTDREKEAYVAQREHNLDRTKPTFGERLSNSIDAFQSGGVQAAASFGDFVLDVATPGDNTWLNKYKEAEWADEFVGYDRREANFQMAEALQDWKNGDYGTAIGRALTTPEVVAESLPLMFEMMLGAGKFKMGAKVVEAGAKAAVGAFSGMANFAKANAGFLAVVGQETNNDVDEFTENNNGVGPTGMDVARMTATNFVLYGMDKAVFLDHFGKGSMSNLTDAVKKSLDIIPNNKLGSIVTGIGITAKSMGAEAGQEYLQTWGELINARMGTDKYGELADVIRSASAQDEALTGAIFGAGAGGQISIAGQVVSTAGEKLKTKADVIKTEEAVEEVKAQAKTKMDEAAQDVVDLEEAAVVEEAKAEAKTASEDVLETILADTEKINIESGMSEADAKKESEVLRTKMADLGMAETITAEDRKAGLHVEVTRPDGIRVAEKGSKKTKTSEVLNVNDDVMSSIVEGSFDKQSMEDILDVRQNTKDVERNVAHLEGGSEVQATIADTAKTIGKTLETDAGMKALEGVIDPDTDNKTEKALRMVSLALGALKGAIVAEDDLHSSAGIENVTEGGARTLGMNTQLGKDYMNSYGLTYAGDAELLNTKYAEIGDKILKFAEEAGLIELSSAKVVAPKVVASDTGKGYFDEKSFEAGTGMEGVGFAFDTAEGKVTTVDTPIARLKDNTGKGRDVNSPKGYAMGILSRLLKPVNYELPTTEPVETVPVHRTIADKHEKIIQDYSKLKYNIKPEFVKLLQEVKDRIYGEDGLKDYDKMTRQDQKLIDLLDLNSTNAALNKRGEEGRSLNRKDNLRKVLDNLDMFKDGADVNFNYESAINQRIHVMQTILDYQGDKFMARNLLTGGEYTTKTESEAKLLVEAVAEELYKPKPGETQEQHMKRAKANVFNPKRDKVLAKAVDMIASDKMDLDNVLYLANRMGINNPFKALSLFQAAHDVSTAKDKSKITSSYMVEQDATASGVVNTLLNLAGNPKVQAVLSRLGIGKDASAEPMDPYDYLNAVVKETSPAYDDEITPELSELTQMGISLRNIAKSPVMTWFYGQTNPNTENSMANSLAVEVANEAIAGSKVALNKLNTVLDTKYTKNTVKTITGQDLAALELHYKNTVAKHYVATLEKAFPGVTGYRNKMNKIFKVLEATKQWDGTIKSAMDAMLGGKQMKMSVQKDKATVSRVDAGKPWVLINQMMNNATSFNVNLQHSSDAALLLLSLKDAMAEFGLEGGIMSVHDAAYSNPEIGIFVKQRYEQYTVELASKYDYFGVAIAEAQTAINKMEDGAAKNAQQKKLDSVAEGHKETLASKQEFLKGTETNIFGNKNVTENEAVVSKPTEAIVEEEVAVEPEMETTEEAVAETTVEPESFTKVLSKAIFNMQKGGDVRAAMKTVVDSLKVDAKYDELLAKVKATLNDEGVELFMGNEYSGNVDIIGVGNTVIDARSKRAFTPEGFLETMAHEVDHAYQAGYISENINSAEVKYMKRVLEKMKTDEFMKKLGVAARARVRYIIGQDGEVSEIAEMVAVMRNEGDVSEEIMRALGTGNTLRTKILALIKNINAWIKGLTSEKRKQMMEGDVDYLATRVTLETLNDNAVVANAEARITGVKPKLDELGMAKAQYTRYKDIYENPHSFVNEAMIKTNAYTSSVIGAIGTNVYGLLYPHVRKGHEAAKKKWDLYEETANLLNDKFVESDMAQRMRKAIGVNNDSKDELIHDLLGIGTDIMQKSQELLDRNMADLDKEIQKQYTKKENQIRLYQIFAKTGIANLQHDKAIQEGVLSGKLSIEDALKQVEAGIDVSDKKTLDDVAEYMITGISKTGITSSRDVSVHKKEVELYVTLKAMSKIDGAQDMLKGMGEDLRNHMYVRSLDVYALNKEVHGNTSDFDGHYMMDVHEDVHEYKMVTERDMKTDKYSKSKDWIVVKEPDSTNGIIGIVARPVIDVANTPGVGLNVNKFNNGFYLDEAQSALITGKTSKMTEKMSHEYLMKNGLMRAGNRYRFVLDEKTKVETLGMKQNIAHSLYRTYVHNKELIETQAIRDIVIESGIDTLKDETAVASFDKKVEKNRDAASTDKEQLPPFLKLDYDYGTYDELPKWIRKYYRTPSNLSTYDGFNRNITLVKRGDADVLLGHKNFKLFGEDSRALAKAEYAFKQLIVLSKMHMVVTAPAKLAVDFMSNLGILTTMDVPVADIYDGFKEGWVEYNNISKLRGEQVQLELDVRAGVKGADKKLEVKKKEIGNSKFYDAYKNGFIQSYSTDLTLKEFDTIAGLQKNIDDMVNAITTDKKGYPNVAHRAIKKWMKFGFEVDKLVLAASKNSKINGTTVGNEMEKLANRLKSKKDEESVARYVSEIIGSPSSEIVALGGATMVITDALSKYTLAKHLETQVNVKTAKKYTTKEAYMEANKTFIDYRQNLPAEVKALSDIGVLMFPAFWMKIQKVIMGLVRYHPATAISGYVIADAIGANGANIIDTNIFNKVSDGTVLNDPTSIVDTDTFSWMARYF